MSTNYGFLTDFVEKLQNQNVLLTESLNLLQNTVNLINEIKGKHCVEVSLKIKKVLARNPGLEEMRLIEKNY